MAVDVNRSLVPSWAPHQARSHSSVTRSRVRKNRLQHIPLNVRQPEGPALELVSETGMVDPERMQDRRVQVMHVSGVFDDIVRVIVCLAEGHARLYASAGEPHREASRMVIAAVVVG